jgi:hypothetical protein
MARPERVRRGSGKRGGRIQKYLTVLVGVVLVGIAAPVASARPSPGTIEGRHNVLRAAMYALAFEGETKPVQVLRRICPKPGRRADCEPASVSLRAAIEDEVAVPITWVGKERAAAGTFYELGLVVRNGDEAHFDYRWDDPRPYGCNGGGRFIFHRIDWTGWERSGGYFFEGCPVGSSV